MIFPSYFYNKYLIQINYRSGIRVKMWFLQFDLHHREGSVTLITYREASSYRKPIYFNVDQIESAYQIGAKRGILGAAPE